MGLITRLSKLSTPHSEAARTELAALIHQTLREAETEYEQLIDEARSNTNSAVPSLVSKTGEDLKIARRQYRKALLAAKHNSSLAEREALFAGRRKPVGNEKVSQRDLLVSASSDATSALRRTQQLLQGELSKSRFASETLAQSTEALKDLSERYSMFDDVLGKSKELIRDLVKKNKSDRWYYEKAIQLLVGTLIWIIVRRLFWGPIWLLVVWPLKTLWWAGAGVVGLGLSKETGLTMSGESVYSSAVTSTVEMGCTVSTSIQQVQGVESVAASQFESEMGESEVYYQPEETEDVQTAMLEVVGKIIDEGSAPIARNTLSRRLDEPPEEETQAQAEAEAEEEVEVQPEVEMAVHDEL
ncbi:hypothetical protein BDD12DRAFT_822002 [Trichophaea hybrida]|nr:hypothetical protein BDD12DRAFT_822002 [Trichophaea hybrida]